MLQNVKYTGTYISKDTTVNNILETRYRRDS